MDDLEILLTTRQLQELLQVDRITIYRMLKDGRLQGFKMGGQWRFSQQAIEEWLRAQRGTAASNPAAHWDIESTPSAEALPLSCMQAIQDVVAEVLDVGAVTTAVDGTPLAGVSNCCEFCELILGTATGRQRCMESWREAAKGSTQDPTDLSGSLPTTCHAGLHYVWEQIVVQGQFVAAAHAGQFLREPPQDDPWRGRLDETSSATGLASEVLRAALQRVTVLDRERHQRMPVLMQRVASTFSEIGEERLGLLTRLQRIAEMTQL